MLVKLIITLIAVSILLAVVIQGYRSIVTSLDTRVVDPVRLNGNPQLNIKENTVSNDLSSLTLLRHDLSPGDLVQHIPITTINDELCGIGQCLVTYQGRVCEDQSNVQSEMVRVSWIAYENENGNTKHIDNIVNDQVNSVNFNRHFGSCILPCSECPISNIVDVSMISKITDKNEILSEAGNNEVWGVNSAGTIYKRPIDGSGTDWTEVPGGLKHVSASGNGYVWGVNNNDEIYKCQKPCSGNWIPVLGGLKQISGGRSEVWGVNSAGIIVKRPVDGSGTGWTEIPEVPGGLKHVSASGKGYVWGVNSNDVIYKCQKPCSGDWLQVPGGLDQISGS